MLHSCSAKTRFECDRNQERIKRDKGKPRPKWTCNGDSESIINLLRDRHFSWMFWALANISISVIFCGENTMCEWINRLRIRMENKMFGQQAAELYST